MARAEASTTMPLSPYGRSGTQIVPTETAKYPRDAGPFLLVIVDTEEEFDWQTFSRSACNVGSIQHQVRAQRIFDRYGVVPTYAVDYAVAAQEEGYGPLREFLKDGRCGIGAHLHPWVTPPFEEEVSARNSFPCNLSIDLELRKLAALTEVISRNFGVRPVLYKAGRYGADAETTMALEALHYEIDCSMLPWTDLTQQSGPDFHGCTSDLYWFGEGSMLLEIPLTTGLVGGLQWAGQSVYRWLDTPQARRFRVMGAFARAGLLDRIRLTPEGTTLGEAKRVSRILLDHYGQRVFTITYHSPSLEPGNTPYVRSETDLADFLRWIEGYLEFFFGELGGVGSTPAEVFRLAAAQRQGREADRPPA